MDFMLGENVGPYRLIEQLGQGGMATVYKAYHARLDRYVAIKALHPAFMQDPNFLARFQREARVIARLEHNHIVPIYDFAEHARRPYLVLKYVKGETLKARLLRRKISEQEIRNIFDAVSSALAYAHQEGVLHRDVKPSNVLLGDNGRIYLSDFGLARIAQAGESTLSAEMMLGTPQYISPEQAKGMSDLDEGTDIYSLGVMLYELLVGKVPFNADTPFSIIHDHIYSPLPLPTKLNPEISEQSERFLLKALAKERQDRYEDIPKMVEAFHKQFTRDESFHTPSPGLVEDMPHKTSIPEPDPGSEEAAPRETTGAENEPQPPDTDRHIEPGGETAGKKKKRVPAWVWWMLIPFVIITCLGLMVLRNALNQPGPGALENEAVFTQEAVVEEDKPAIDVSGFGFPELEQKIRENPDDPFLLIDLAVKTWQNDQFEETERAVWAAMDFARDDPDLYLDFAFRLTEHGIWLFAAPNFIYASRTMPDPPENINELIEQSIYFAAGQEKGSKFLRDPEYGLDSVTLKMIDVREALVRGEVGNAERILEGVVEQIPDSPVVGLLRVDLHLQKGEIITAENILREMEARDDIPEWIRMEMDEYFRIIEKN